MYIHLYGLGVVLVHF